MKLQVVLLCFAISIIFISREVTAMYATYTHIRMTHKLFQMERELIRDAMMNVRRVQFVRKRYKHTSAYRLAEIIYYIRRLYVRMIFLYDRGLENLNTITQNRLVEYLAEIQHIHIHIDHLIDMMEEYEDRNTNNKRITRTGKEIKQIARIRVKDIMKSNFEDEKKRNELKKNKAYMERKKMAWLWAHGKGVINNKRPDIMEDGFESDMFK